MPDETTKLDRIIEAIPDVLPATSYKEIASKVARALREQVSRYTVSDAIATVRRNPAEYGYDIPHVKRGPATASDTGRYFVLLVDREGHYELDDNPAASVHLNNGSGAVSQHASTMLGNHAKILRLGATHTRSTNSRARLNELADDFEYVARKAAAVAREIANAA